MTRASLRRRLRHAERRTKLPEGCEITDVLDHSTCNGKTQSSVQFAHAPGANLAEVEAAVFKRVKATSAAFGLRARNPSRIKPSP